MIIISMTIWGSKLYLKWHQNDREKMMRDDDDNDGDEKRNNWNFVNLLIWTEQMINKERENSY